MPLEAATYISDLVATNPVHTDPLSAADSQMRLIKQVLKNTFPNANAAITATGADLNAFVPIGGIILWSGSFAGIPANWRLCNGASGTPNLIDRFVIAAGGSYTPGVAGGSFTTTADGGHSHPGSLTDAQGAHIHNTAASGSADTQGSHSHGGTQAHALTISEMPAHTHFGGSLQVAAVAGGNFGSSTPWYQVGNSGSQAIETSQGSGAGHSHGIGADGAHGHGVTTTGVTDTQGLHSHNVALPTDGAHAHVATPPYYPLYYIMRVS